MTTTDQDARVKRGLRRRVIAGYLVMVFFFGVFVVYAAAVEIRGAVIAPGNMVVEGNIRRVQHQDGGSVAAIMVRSGHKVHAGDMLLRMNETQARAELGVVMVQLYGQQVRSARLAAERDEAEAIRFPAPPSEEGIEKDSARIIDDEHALFQARRKAKAGEVAQLKERSQQIEQEIEGLSAQAKAIEAQAAVVRSELVGLEELLKKGLTQLGRINPQRLNLAQLEGQAGELRAQIARARGRISEINVQIAQVSRTTLGEVTKDLREASEKIADLQERRIAAEAKLQRVEVRAPISGVIHQLNVFTIGGVVAPGETLMQIVPENEKLLVESRIDPSFIDQVSVGQSAIVRFTSFDQHKTPELAGRVVFVSADVEIDQQQQQQQQPRVPYFRARVELIPGEIEKLVDQSLTSGLPAEVHLQTRERTILSYLMKPLTDQIYRTFRER